MIITLLKNDLQLSISGEGIDTRLWKLENCGGFRFLKSLEKLYRACHTPLDTNLPAEKADKV
jgi:hypothetical protein